MKLVSAKVGPFKSINVTQEVQVEPDVTVFVGMNEAGKTVFLRALQKSNDALNEGGFKPIYDYPRKDLSSYLKRHESNPEIATELTYALSADEANEVNVKTLSDLKEGFRFSVSHRYNDGKTIGLHIDEKVAVKKLVEESGLSSDSLAAALKAQTIRGLPDALKDVSRTPEDETFLAAINARISATPSAWTSVLAQEAWQVLTKKIPKFLYFSDYDLLPSKMNLADLAQRVAEKKTLQPKHKAVLALLRMADISMEELSKPVGYEALKAKIEGVSLSLTDQIMAFWKQNEDLEVEIDIKADAADEVPFNNGPNLYLRIKNRRHRGVSTPFDQRSRGFIWFFSFLVWFDSVHHQIEAGTTTSLILLLDEPGLALHALAQADFLKYIDTLSETHQVLYSTHSPFMVHSPRLHQVRVVEDKNGVGTTISGNVSGSDPRTIFPLQAALGWSLAQNLFISEKNLVVEGPAELIYLQFVSGLLELENTGPLASDITIVPAGGLDKVSTFVALLGANGLKLAVLHDYNGSPDQRLADLVKHKLISPNESPRVPWRPVGLSQADTAA